MTSVAVGAAADELGHAARELRAAADQLDQHAVGLSALLGQVAWIGDVADRFLAEWTARHRPRLAGTVSALRTVADQLDRQAEEQRLASATDRASPTGTAPRPVGRGIDGEPLGRLRDQLAVLGVTTSSLESVVEVAGHLAHEGVVDDLIEFVRDPVVAGAIASLDQLVDLGTFVVDLLRDLDATVGMPPTERLVHALADAGLRFAVAEGIDQGVTWLSTTLMAAVVPGLGGAAGYVAGSVLGHTLATVTDQLFRRIDDDTDVVDSYADMVVDAYRDLARLLGAAGELVAIGADVVGGAADLAGDVGSVLAAGGGTVVGLAGRGLGVIGL